MGNQETRNASAIADSATAGDGTNSTSHGEQITAMTVFAFPTADAVCAGPRDAAHPPGRVEGRNHATRASGLVHEATAPLLAVLENCVAAAAVRGINDTGARRTADALLDARVALDLAIAAAGRALADRDVHMRRADSRIW
jgi:hypothetical protein